jgi:hypothetical protein
MLVFPIEYHPFLVDLEWGAVRWQVDEMMPSQKRFPLIYNNHKCVIGHGIGGILIPAKMARLAKGQTLE